LSVLRHHAWLRVAVRLLLFLVSVELSLALAAFLLERLELRAAPPSAEIVCIGDSNTFGIGAPAGRSYPDQLQELLAAAGDPRRVANLGVPGFCTRQIVDRLEETCRGSPPACVVFLGGFNDMNRAADLLRADSEEPSLGQRIGAAFLHLRTVRVARAAWSVVRGDRAHREYGGADATALPPAAGVPRERWAAEFARARAAGPAALGDWLQMLWRTQDPAWMRAAFDALRARPDFDATKRLFRYPVDEVEWELAWLGGAPLPPLAPHPESREADAYARYAAACGDLAGGRLDAARRRFSSEDRIDNGPWGRCLQRTLAAWALLMERDWRAADRELAAALADSRDLSPQVALPALLGATALAHVLSEDPAARLADSASRAGRPANEWRDRGWWDDDPIGREWMAVAEFADAVKGGTAAEREATLARARKRFQEPRTKPLRWVLAHPGATLDELRAGLELEPCRVAWMGVCPILFRMVGGEEFARIVAPEHDRLERSAREHGFRVVVLTYLADDNAFVNERLRTVAAEKRWALADVHARLALSDVYADDRRTHFSPDRSHPNEAGYALEARAVFDALRAAH
jgi:lysophospholipase L1-like esterase